MPCLSIRHCGMRGRSPHGERGLKSPDGGTKPSIICRSPHRERGLKFKLITGRLRDFHPRERALTRRTRNARNGSGLVPGVPTCLKSFMGLGKYLHRGEDKGNPPASFIHTALFNRHRLAFQKAAPIVRINHADCLQICVNYRRPNELHAPFL